MRHLAVALLLIAGWNAAVAASDDGLALQRAEHARWLAAGTLHRCQFRAYTFSDEPVDLRSAPANGAPVIGRLPAATYDPDIGAELGPEMDVLEARNGWFRVRSHDPTVSGWVPGRVLEFDLQTDKAFIAPDANGAVVATSWDMPDGRMQFTWREPSDCKGHWVKALFTGRDGIERSGWAAGVCANQLTTCDSVYGEMLPYKD